MNPTGPLELPEGIFVDGATALELASAMRLVAREARRNGGSLSPRLAALARSSEAVGDRWAANEREAYRRRNVGIPTGDGSAKVPLVGSIGTKEAAGILVSPRAVTARAKRGTLPGRRIDRTWVFDLPDVADALEGRKEVHA